MNALLENKLRFRPMLETDLAEVMAIELSAYPFPWTKTIFRDCIRIGYYCEVLETHGRVDAYGVMSICADEAHILNLCVRPELHGHGLARPVLEHLLDCAYTGGARTTFLEVRPSNTAALRLYAAAGFCELGKRPGYYPAEQGREDALLMAKELT